MKKDDCNYVKLLLLLLLLLLLYFIDKNQKVFYKGQRIIARIGSQFQARRR
jgi:cell shape-determining protein MreC